MIMKNSVWSILYLQGSVFLLGTDFSSKQENIESKNDAISIRKNYMYKFF